MPIIKSAKKRARQSIVRQARNLKTKDSFREARKQLTSAFASKNRATIDKALKAYQSALDTSVKKKVIHRNKAARLLSTAMKKAGGSIASSAPKKKTAPAKTSTKPKAKPKTVAKKPTKKPVATKKPAKAPAKKTAVAKKPAKKS